ncbi:MAG: branched-chain amino acid ABC transporter substrate-binding protein [Dongiaceae bacterium]
MRKLTLPLVAAVATAALAMSPAKAQDIVVATAGPITGQYASFGEQMKRGAERAVADINAAGGLLGKQLRLEVGDDACVPEQARSVAEDLVSKEVVFVAGHFCSSSSIPASEVYAENNVLMISPASTNPAFTEGAAEKGWTNILRTCGRDDAQGVVAGKFLAEKYAGKAVAIVHDKSTYGKGIADETKKAMNAAGLQEAMYEAINQGDKDFSALISKMKGANVEAIYLGTYHTEGGLIARQAKEQGLNAQIVGEDAFVTNEFWSIAGDAGEGVLMTFAPDPRKFETAKAVVDEFKAEGYDPEGYTLYTYAAMQVWAEAVKQTGTTDPKSLGGIIRKNTYKTVLGDLSFDAKGDIVNPVYVFYKWSNGEYAEVPGM